MSNLIDTKNYRLPSGQIDFKSMAEDEIAAGKWVGWPRQAVVSNLRHNARQDFIARQMAEFAPLQGDN